MEARRFLPALLAVPLLLAGLTLVPGAQAQESGWTTAFLPASQTACTGTDCPVYAAQHDGEVLVAFESSTSAVLILHKASDSAAWVEKSTNALAGPAPAVVGSVGGLEYFSAADKWVLTMDHTGATANFVSSYGSTDDGATWSLESSFDAGATYFWHATDNFNGALSCLYTSGTGVGALLRLGCDVPRPVPDGGAGGAIAVNDNKGDPSATTTASLGQPNLGIVHGNDPVFSVSSNGIFTVECEGAFCEVPYGTKATGPQDGSTTVLRSYACFSDDTVAAPTTQFIGLAGGVDEGGVAYVAAADADKICVGFPSFAITQGSIITNPTAATGAFAEIDGTDWHYTGPAAQHGLTAAWDNTANKNYVFYGTTLTFENTADTKTAAVTCGTAKCYFVYRDGSFGGAMRVSEATDFPAIDSIQSTATATVTDLVAFDIDPTGTTAIARTENGDKVVTWDAQGLGTGNTFDTNCPTSGPAGITAAVENIVFLDCNGADTIKIKSSIFGDASLPLACTASDASFFDEWAIDNDETTQEISDLGYFSVNWEATTSGECLARAVLVISTRDGKIGLFTGTFSDDLAEAARTGVFKQYTASNQPVVSVCGIRFNDEATSTAEDLAIFAVNPAASTVGYRWNFNFEAPTLSLYKTFGGVLGGQDGLDCTGAYPGEKILLGSGSGIRAVAPVTGTQLWSRTDIIPETDAVAVSYDGRWAATYTTTGKVFVLNGTTGATILEVPAPAGAFRDIALDATGQNLWVATASNIARYQIYESTTGDPEDTCTTFCQGPVQPPTVDGGDGGGGTGFTGASNGLGAIFGGGDAGGAILMAILFVFLFAGFGYELFNGKVIGAGIGALCGFAYGVFQDLVPGVITFLIVVAAVAFIGVRFFGGRSQASGAEM